MSNLSWDSNTWYSVQNFGSDWFLAAGNVNGNSGPIATSGSSTEDNSVWQIGTVNGLHYLRAKEQQNAYCMTSDGESLRLEQCSADSSVWNIETWNARDAGNGNFFTSSTSSNDTRLYVNTEGTTVAMKKYSSSNSGEAVFYQWAIASVSAIDDSAYSTLPSSTSSSSSTSSISGGSNTTNVTPAPTDEGTSTRTNFVTITGTNTPSSSDTSSPTDATSSTDATDTPSNPTTSSPVATVGLNGTASPFSSSNPLIIVLALGLGTLLTNGIM